MIVLRRIVDGVWDHAGVRFTEWLGAAPLLGVGYVLWAQPEAIYNAASFAALATWATAMAWACMLLTCGNMRLVALFVNGTFKQFRHSPTIRFVASVVSFAFWTLFTIGTVSAWKNAGGSPTAIVAYGTFALLELRNVYVSRVDMAMTLGNTHVRNDR